MGRWEKPGHQVEVEAQELEDVVFGRAPLPLGVAHGDLRHPPGKEVGQGGDEARRFMTLVDAVHHFPAVGPEHAAVISEFDPGDPGHGEVHKVGGEGAEPGIQAVFPPAPHGVVALLQLGNELGNVFGEVLKVGVQSDHHLAPGGLKAGEDGLVLAEVADELDNPDLPGMALMEVREKIPGAVGGAVVHENNLEGAAAGREGVEEALAQLRQILFLVKTGMTTEI